MSQALTETRNVVPPSIVELDVKDYVEGFRRHKKNILRFVAVCVLLAFIYAMLSVPYYSSTSTIRIQNDASVTGMYSGIDTMAETEVNIIRSRSVIREALERSGVGVEVIPVHFSAISNSPMLDKALLRVRKSAFISGFTNVNIVQISNLNLPTSLRSRYLKLVVDNSAGVRLYYGSSLLLKGKVGENLESKYRSVNDEQSIQLTVEGGVEPGAYHIMKLDEDQAVNRVAEVLEVEQILVRGSGNLIKIAFSDPDKERARNFLNSLVKVYLEDTLDKKSAGVIKTIAYLEQDMPRLKADMEKADKSLEQFKKQNNVAEIEIETTSVRQALSELETRLSEANQIRKENSSRYTSMHPVMVGIDNQIAFLNAEIASTRKRIAELPEIYRKYFELQRTVDALNDNYANNLQKMNDLQIEAASIVGYAKLIDSASVSFEPISPQTGKILVYSLIISSIISLAISALISSPAFARCRSVRQVERKTGSNVIATIPYSDAQRSMSLGNVSRFSILAEVRPADKASQSIAVMADQLEYMKHIAGCNVFAFSALGRTAGASFISINLAWILSDKSNVLLIDADLKRGNLHNFLEITSESGLTEVIAGKAKVEDAISSRKSGKLSLIISGRKTMAPDMFLNHENFRKLISGFADKYDYVIINLPPLTRFKSFTGALPFMNLIAVVSTKTTLGVLGKVISTIERYGVILRGVILNVNGLGGIYAGKNPKPKV